jgi:DNA-binding HxlR family transcriptional regulator
MERVCFESKNCSVARAMDVIGDWWSMKSLQEHVLLLRVESEKKVRRVEYRLTPKGSALHTVLIALMQWGDDWMNAATGAPVVLCNAKNGAARRGCRPTGGNELCVLSLQC